MKTSNKKDYNQNKTRQQIVSDNIMHYVKKKNMSQSEFADKMGISQQDLSKKKANRGSSFNVDDVYNASKILDVTFNDLCYEEEEKVEISVLNDKKYDPIMATKQVEVKYLNESFKTPDNVLATSIGSCLIIGILLIFLINKSEYFSFLILLIPILSLGDFKSSFGINQTYSINYLDDIYYVIKEEKNKYFISCLMLNIVQILIVLACTFLPIFTGKLVDSNTIYIRLYFVTALIILIVSMICLIFGNKKILKKKIYQSEIKSYLAKLINVVANLSLFSLSIFMLINGLWYVTILLLINSALGVIDFILISNKYNEYKMVYQEYGKEERELFPKEYEFKDIE